MPGVEHKVSHFPELGFVVSVERYKAEHSRSCSVCVTVSPTVHARFRSVLALLAGACFNRHLIHEKEIPSPIRVL